MEEPLRYQRAFGLDAGQLDELQERIEDILPEPWRLMQNSAADVRRRRSATCG